MPPRARLSIAAATLVDAVLFLPRAVLGGLDLVRQEERDDAALRARSPGRTAEDDATAEPAGRVAAPLRALRFGAALALAATLGCGAVTVVLGLNAESTAMRTVDGAMVLLVLVVATGLSFLIWPGR